MKTGKVMGKENINKEDKKTEKPEKKESSPYINKGIYDNYFKGMKEKNIKRVKQGLNAIPVRTFEEWSSN